MPGITRKEAYKIKPFRHIAIVDPWYMQDEEFSKRKALLFDEGPRCCRVGAVVVKQFSHNSVLDGIQAEIILAKDEAQLDVYLQAKEYKNTRKTEVELHCESDDFVADVTDKKGEHHSMKFDTTSAELGFAVKYKEYYGMRIVLDFDEVLYSFEEIVDSMSNLFGFKDRDLILFEENTEEMEME